MPSITGGIVIVGARILVPIDAATAREGLVIPLVGTVAKIGEIIGTVKAEIPEPVEAILDVISTVGTIQSGVLNRVDVVTQIGSIVDGKLTSSVIGGLINIATVGTIFQGKLTASIMDGRLAASIIDGRLAGSIIDGRLTASVMGGVINVATIGTITEGRLTASIMGGVINVATIGTIFQGRLTASISDGRLAASIIDGRLAGSIIDGRLTASIIDGRLTASIMGGIIGSITDGRVTASIIGGVVGTVGVIPFIGTVGIIPFVGTIGTILTMVEYTQIIASIGPLGTLTSTSISVSRFPGGIGFSIAYITEELTSATIYIQNSFDNVIFRTIGTLVVHSGGQEDVIFKSTRPFWRFIAINPSTLSSIIEAVISRYPW